MVFDSTDRVSRVLNRLSFIERFAIRILVNSPRILAIEIGIDIEPESMTLERIYHMPSHGEEDGTEDY